MEGSMRARRQGGRSARLAARSTAPAADARPVSPGLPGGRYQPLAAEDVEKIHESALEVLETIGMGNPIPSCVDLVTAAGGSLSDRGRLLFPRGLVEDVIAKAGRRFVLHGQTPDNDLAVSGKRVNFGTAGAAVSVIDLDSGEYRDSTLKDLYDIARLADTLDNIHFFQRPVVARDVEGARELDLNTAYACIAGTTKHIGTSFIFPENLTETVAMLDLIAGGEGEFAKRPFVSFSCCFAVPPLRFAEDACRTLEAGVRAGMPVLLLSAGQAGATSSAALAGSIVQSVAEVLAGLVYVNLIAPGHPAVLGTWPFVSDLRTGAMSGGSGEQGLLMAAAAQMGHFYDLTVGIAAGMSDAKIPDAQSGYEKGYTTALAGLAGGNLIYESAGMQGSLLAACYESFVIDNDMLGAVLRMVRGIEIDDAKLSIEVMREVTSGPEHFLGHGQTLSLMESEYIYPRVGDRSSPGDWAAQGAPDVRARAKLQARETLSGHFPSHIPAEIDAVIRERYPIRLPREAMRRSDT